MFSRARLLYIYIFFSFLAQSPCICVSVVGEVFSPKKNTHRFSSLSIPTSSPNALPKKSIFLLLILLCFFFFFSSISFVFFFWCDGKKSLFFQIYFLFQFFFSLTSCSFSRIPVDFYDSDNDSPTHTQHDMRLDIIQHESHIATMASTFVSRTIEEKNSADFSCFFSYSQSCEKELRIFFDIILQIYMHLRIFALMKSRLFRKSKHFFRVFQYAFFSALRSFNPADVFFKTKWRSWEERKKKCVNNSIRARQRKILRKKSHPERALHRLVLLSDNFHEKIRIERKKKSAHFTRGERKVAALCLAVIFFLPLSSSTGDERRGRLAHSLCMSEKFVRNKNDFDFLHTIGFNPFQSKREIIQ